MLVGCLVFACKDDDEAPSHVIFTYSAGNNGHDVNPWIIVRAYETGELLDAQEVTSNGPVYLKSNKDIPNNKLSVCLFTISKASGEKESADAYVINGLNVGDEWKSSIDWNVIQDQPTEEIGTYQLTVTDINSTPFAYSLSDQYGDRTEKLLLADNSLAGPVKIRKGASEHLLSITIGLEDPRYVFLSDLTDGDNKTISYNDLKEFDKVVKIEFPENNVTSAYNLGYNDAVTYGGWNLYVNLARGYFPYPTTTELNLGYLDRFKNNLTQLQINDDFVYWKRGAAPSSIDYIGSEKFTITNRSISDYAATTSINYNYRVVTYAYSNSASTETEVFVSYLDATPDTRHNEPFTPELIQKYSIPIEKATHLSSFFYVKGETWEQNIDRLIGRTESPLEIERAYVIAY